ncbi:uncharacterized protein BDW47DRAFT_114184, partial [Aspergillus candidus]
MLGVGGSGWIGRCPGLGCGFFGGLGLLRVCSVEGCFEGRRKRDDVPWISMTVSSKDAIV